MKLSLKKLLAKVLTLTNNTGTVTPTTTGTVTTQISYWQSGYIVHTFGIVAATASVASGSNLFVGTVTGIPKPVGNIRCTAYYGDNAVVSALDKDGSVTSRNCGDDTLAAGNNALLCWVYITDGTML